MKTALITGSGGQDGTYLSNHLRRQGYQVIGVTRTPATVNLIDPPSVFALLEKHRPDEIYLLAAFHHSAQEKIADDLEIFRRSREIHVIATANFLEGIVRHCPAARLFLAASCHVYGPPPTPVQDETTPMNPDGLYGITKLAAMHLCRYYRQKHGVFASSGILYNHESPLRPANFVSKKIVQAAVAISRHRQERLVLGDLETEIDWGFAGDYVEAMQKILQLTEPDDFVISSGEKHRIREFVEAVFKQVGLDWQQFVVIDPGLLRRTARLSLFGNPAKLQRLTGWKPTTTFAELVHLMVVAEQEEQQRP